MTEKKGKVIGLGGIFFKSKNPEETKAWYKEHLGIDSGKYGGQFIWRAAEGDDMPRSTAWSPMPESTDYYAPSNREFMINYRVENLDSLLEQLKAEGINSIGEVQEFEYGKFAWIMDPDGTKIELWEPIDSPIIEPPMNKSR